MLAMGIFGGCATVIGVASDAGLKAMDPKDRATYRDGLDEVDEAIHQAQAAYDAQYDRTGEPLPLIPEPTPEE